MDLRSSEWDVVSLYVVCCSDNVSVCLVCSVLDSVCDFLVKHLVMWIDRVWSSTECACCACDLSVHLSVPSICFVCMSEVISSFKSLRAVSHMFALFCVLRVCELFGETIHNVFGCSCYFVVEYYGCV